MPPHNAWRLCTIASRERTICRMAKYHKENARNVMSFSARLCTNSLNSPDNLVRWGKRNMGSCPLCKAKCGTLAHIVNFCPVSLKQGRFTWRHDSVLKHMTQHVKNQVSQDTQVFADIPGSLVNGTTIPADILVSTGEGSKPDLVIVNRVKKEITLLELTCSLPKNTQKAHSAKRSKYTQLEIALTNKGYKVNLVPFEVNSNGNITKTNKQNIEQALRKHNIKIKSQIFKNLSQISLLCTMSIFHAYQETEWTAPPLLSP